MAPDADLRVAVLRFLMLMPLSHDAAMMPFIFVS